MPEQPEAKPANEQPQNEKLRKLLAESDLASDNTTATANKDGKPISEYLENRPPHHG